MGLQQVNITEVRIKLLPARQAYEDRLRAFCTVTFDHAFVVRDLKIIEGQNGYFVAMPSRKLTARCARSRAACCACKRERSAATRRACA